MAWGKVLGHDAVVEQFRRALARERLASTFLFVGPEGIGKRMFALRLAQAMLCDRHPEQALSPCERCPACQQVAALSHPDLELIYKPEDAAFIPLELLIGDAEHRMREGLCYNISLKPFSGKRRIALIDDADYFRVEGANCLLKTLEEPPPGAVIILLATSEQRQLPTIRSRSQAIRFQPLAASEIATILQQHAWVETAEEAAQLAARAEGSVTRALELRNDALHDFRSELFDQLSRREFDTASLVKTTSALVDAAGKEAPVKRARLKQILQLAIDYYRLLLKASMTPLSEATEMERAAQIALRWWPGEQAAADCIELSLKMFEAVEANAAPANLLECWYDELAQIGRLGRTMR